MNLYPDLNLLRHSLLNLAFMVAHELLNLLLLLIKHDLKLVRDDLLALLVNFGNVPNQLVNVLLDYLALSHELLFDFLQVCLVGFPVECVCNTLFVALLVQNCGEAGDLRVAVDFELLEFNFG